MKRKKYINKNCFYIKTPNTSQVLFNNSPSIFTLFSHLKVKCIENETLIKPS